MKKIVILLVSLFISLSVISQSNAWTNTENKLYKQVSITSKQVEKDYWKIAVSKIRDQFIMYRYTKNTVFLNKLEKALKSWIQKLNSKKILSVNQRKKLNLYNNIYYRTKLLLDYNLK